ncbi:MAG: YggT family protein [Actinobacteria bacterium]|jgi:YggT family protein|nr:YggT family protein [Actinomycetota bacterium]NCG37212.1 YggT family protein [Actinomycetota bacterium]
MAEIVCTALLLYLIAIFGRIILSWFPLDPTGFGATIAGFLYMVTDPVLGPLRRYIPPLRLGAVALDLSSIIVIFGISILRSAICS